MSNVYPYPTVQSDDDLAHLAPEERAARLKFRRELIASLPRRPTAQELHDRERQEAKARETNHAGDAGASGASHFLDGMYRSGGGIS